MNSNKRGSENKSEQSSDSSSSNHFYSTGAALWSLCPFLPDPIESATKRRRLESTVIETQPQTSSSCISRIPPDFEPMERASESKHDGADDRFQVKVIT